MPPLLILFAAIPQAATPATPTPTPTTPSRWSIQVDPYADAPYAAARPCPEQAGSDVVVCARPNVEERLPLPDERGPPDGPRRVVKYLDDAQGPQGDSLWRVTEGLHRRHRSTAAAGRRRDRLVKGAFARKPDKRGRVPIPLDNPALPARAGP